MAGRRITVFGGSGFIGRHLVRRLAARGWVVRVAVRDVTAAEFLKPMGNVGQIVPMRCNVSDEAAVKVAVEGSEAVVNLIGVLYETSRRPFSEMHVAAPARIAKAAAAAGAKRFVQVSAIDADPGAEADYARTKGEGEEAVKAAFPNATILRPSVVFGPEDSFFNLFAALARYLPVIPMFGFGDTQFQPVYVGDVAEAIIASLERDDAQGKTYELGGPRSYSYKELLELTCAETRRKRLLVPYPWQLLNIHAWFLERLPLHLLTRDQLKMLRRPNVVPYGALGIADLGIEPTPVETIIPTYLERFRPGGRFARTSTA